MRIVEGPLSAVQTLAIEHPYTQNTERGAVIRNEKKTQGQVLGMTERWANQYLNREAKPCVKFTHSQ